MVRNQMVIAKVKDILNNAKRSIGNKGYDLMLNYVTNRASNKQILDDAMTYLRDIPVLQKILNDLPDNIKYFIGNEVLANSICVAKYVNKSNLIMINTKRNNYYTPQGKFRFLLVLAHELCHANQKKSGLTASDLKESSFNDKFRVSKMEEIEACLLNAIVAKELLKKTEFKNCRLPIELLIYENKLKQKDQNESKAKQLFVLSYWTNSTNTVTETYLDPHFQRAINSWYLLYTRWAYDVALKLQTGIYTSTNRSEPLQVIQTYCQRMGLTKINPKIFLENRVDKVKISESAKYKYQMALLNNKGKPYIKYVPAQELKGFRKIKTR